MLRVENLQTHFHTAAGVVRAVDGVSFELAAARTLALVGESGCGKSVTALSILGLVPPPGHVVAGRLLFDGRDLRTLNGPELRAIRGGRIAMIFQEPMTCLNPVLTVGQQLGEAVRLHRRGLSRSASKRAAIDLLTRVGIAAPELRLRDHPHRLSGGMRQRVMIAMALAGDPELLIADEPTTALDVTIQAQILSLLRELQHANGMAILLVTHDFGVVAQAADHVCVMYAGRVVERGPAASLFAGPQHPYTRGLLHSVPSIEPQQAPPGARRRLAAIPGQVPSPLKRPPGCAFHPRCDTARGDERCLTQVPLLSESVEGHDCACWKPGPQNA